MTLSPAQKKAQGLILAELKKELDEMDRHLKKNIYPEPDTIKLQNEGGRGAVEWIRGWIEEKETS